MSDRKAMGKSLRMSILARDHFTCQYCGARAPAVQLHVEHIVSVVDGGSNHPANLAASCQDCNLGKGRRSLLTDTVLGKQHDLEILQIIPRPLPKAAVAPLFEFRKFRPIHPIEQGYVFSLLEEAHFASVIREMETESRENFYDHYEEDGGWL